MCPGDSVPINGVNTVNKCTRSSSIKYDTHLGHVRLNLTVYLSGVSGDGVYSLIMTFSRVERKTIVTQTYF